MIRVGPLCLLSVTITTILLNLLFYFYFGWWILEEIGVGSSGYWVTPTDEKNLCPQLQLS